MTASAVPVPVPRSDDALTPDSFAQVALLAGRGRGACLVATALNAAGVSGGHLVIVPDLPPEPQARSRVVARTVLYLHAAVDTDWEYVAYAIVEPTHDGQHAVFAVIEPLARRHS